MQYQIKVTADIDPLAFYDTLRSDLNDADILIQSCTITTETQVTHSKGRRRVIETPEHTFTLYNMVMLEQDSFLSSNVWDELHAIAIDALGELRTPKGKPVYWKASRLPVATTEEWGHVGALPQLREALEGWTNQCEVCKKGPVPTFYVGTLYRCAPCKKEYQCKVPSSK